MAQRSTQPSLLGAARTLLVLVLARGSSALYVPTARCGPSQDLVATTLEDVPEAAAQLASTAPTPAPAVTETPTTSETWTEGATAASDDKEDVTTAWPATVAAPTAVTANATTPSVVVLNIAPPRMAVAEHLRGDVDAEAPQQPLEEPLLDSMLRQSFQAGRYASRYDGPYGMSFGAPQGRSLYKRVSTIDRPPPPPPPQPNEIPEIPEIRKDVYIHLAADEPPRTTVAPSPTLAPRKHYKIIVIKPPTPAPPVEVTTRGVDLETLIYVLVPKADALPAVTTTPRPPSKHEVFFIRYKAPTTTTTAVPKDDDHPDIDVRSAGGFQALADKSHRAPNRRHTLDQAGEGSDSHPTSVQDGEDANELDGEVRDDDAVNDLLSVSTDDILRSWRRSDGDIHFDADLKRIARSHSSAFSRTAEEDIDAVHKAVGDAVGEALSVAAVPQRPGPATSRCAEYAAAEDLNAALSVEQASDEGGQHIPGGPDFEAVRQGRAHYGRSVRSVALCAEPFAIRDDVVPTATSTTTTTTTSTTTQTPYSARQGAITTKNVKFSAKFSSSMGL